VARKPGFAGGGDAWARRRAETERGGEGETDRWGPAGNFYFLFFLGCDKRVHLLARAIKQLAGYVNGKSPTLEIFVLSHEGKHIYIYHLRVVSQRCSTRQIVGHLSII